MPKFVIERAIPNVGQLSGPELREASAKSCRVLHDLGPRIQWIQSHVTPNKIYCLYLAPSPELIREHAVRAGLPADSVQEVKATIDPTTAE